MGLPEPIVCAADYKALLETVVCLYSVSKDVKGEMKQRSSEKQECSEDENKCVTLKTAHEMKLALKSHECDSPKGKLLTGGMTVAGLVHAFESGSGMRRGVHAGAFKLQSTNVLVTGTLSGVTNVGVHRGPPFKDCEKCVMPGIMSGRLCGQIEKAPDKQLLGCEVIAMYRLQYKPTAKGGDGAIYGTLEGEIVCRCD